MRAYKGFDKDLKCRDFQFEIGGEYEEPDADLCNAGFHACENPLDVFGYYPPADSRYCEVELDETSGQKSDDSKVCGKKIKVGLELGIKGLVEAGVRFIFEKIDWKNAKEFNTVNRSAATSTGNQSAATNTGDRSAATSTGDWSAATNTGDRSAATNTGNQSAATNTGDYGAATVEGEDSVAIATGYKGKARGKTGRWIGLIERDDDGKIVFGKMVCVDGVKIKEDTFYTLRNKRVVKADDE